jgi:FKBP-type peptidyl-prolyl cis-trans isomerase
MKWLPLILALGCAPLLRAQDKIDLTNTNQKLNYAFGLDVVSTLQKQDFDIDMQAFMAGMADSLAGKPALTPEQKAAALKELQACLQAKAEARHKLAAVNNLRDGAAFLAANAKKEGVIVKPVTAPDGSPAELQYKVLKTGSGTGSPKLTDVVEVHYHGTLIDGTVFDSSVRRGIPATFTLQTVIPGWQAALRMMKPGDQWQLFIPPKLAYGEYGLPRIGPNSTLIFEVELLSFYAPTNAPAGKPANP